MIDSVPMTKKGYELVKAELERLKTRERPKIVMAIKEAREHGDLSENAEYDAAKEAQGMLEAKIRDLEHKIAHANVIDTSSLSGDRVVFGATVTMEDFDTGEERTYRIVGADEADVKEGLISVESPMARALINRSIGDLAKVRTPNGVRKYEILQVEFE